MTRENYRQSKHRSEDNMKKKTSPKTANRPANEDPTAVQPIEEAIAKRAHELFLARGGTHGSDLDDWLQAERELKAGATTTP